jgi:hypothetical protein
LISGLDSVFRGESLNRIILGFFREREKNIAERHSIHRSVSSIKQRMSVLINDVDATLMQSVVFASKAQMGNRVLARKRRAAVLLLSYFCDFYLKKIWA